MQDAGDGVGVRGELSWRAGAVVRHDRTATIADGVAVRVPIPEALDDLRGLVDDMWLVDDTDVLAAMRLVHRHVGVVSEPSGASASLSSPR